MFFISLFPRVLGKRETLWLCTLRYTVAYAEYSRNSKVGTWRRLAKAKGYLEDELVFLLVTELVFLGWCFFLPSNKMLKCLAGRGWIQGLNQPMNFENLRRWLRKRCLLKYLTKYEPDCNWTWKRFHFYFGWWDWFESNKVHIINTRAKGECRVNQVAWTAERKWVCIFSGDECSAFGCPQNKFVFMKYENDEVQQKVGPFWKDAYHGTWFYGLWSLLFHGILLESRNEDQGVISLFQICSLCLLFLFLLSKLCCCARSWILATRRLCFSQMQHCPEPMHALTNFSTTTSTIVVSWRREEV